MRRATPKYDSCWKGMPEDRKGNWPWEAMHCFRHSPIPFSLGTFVERVRSAPVGAEFTEADATSLVNSALDWKWIVPDDPGIPTWRGNISPKK